MTVNDDDVVALMAAIIYGTGVVAHVTQGLSTPPDEDLCVEVAYRLYTKAQAKLAKEEGDA